MIKLDPKEYPTRRKQLLANLTNNSIAIIPSASHQIRNRDVEYYFRQDSDFYYLTGFDEPNSVLVLIPGREHGEVVLFCQEKDSEREIWDGYRLGPDAAISELKVDDAFPVSDIDEILPGLIEGRERIYYAMGVHTEFDQQVMSWVNSIRNKVKQGANPPKEISAIEPLLHEMRLIKSPAEIDMMRAAGRVSAEAHMRAMKLSKSKVGDGLKEFQLEAEIIHEFHSNGSRWPAYESIVGAGKNACVLHYTTNRDDVNDGDLVLIDAGCELDYYAADITRTFPANGKFTQEQSQIYQLVLDAQEAALECISPKHNWNDFHLATVRKLTEGLVELGLLTGPVDKAIEEESYKEFYMHRTGHWLGMDVHDVGDYKIDGQWRLLEPGMVLTVEPGIYISPDNLNVDAKWRGIGVRIEDDVLVTKTGFENLTAAVPKAINDIERLMAE